jgi:hypothetical protein
LSASPHTPQLRPLSIGEILDAGFRLLRHRFGTLMLCVLGPIVPLSILGTLILASSVEGAFDPNYVAPAGETDTTAIAGFIVGFVLQSVTIALAIAACFKAVSAAYVGEREGAGASLRFALGRVLPLIVTYVLIILILIPAFFLLVIPMIWLGVKLSMAYPAVVCERKGPFRAIGRSWKLTRDNWWRTFATLLVTAVLVFVVALAVNFVLQLGVLAVEDAGPLAVATVSTIVNIATTAVTYPLWAAIVTVMYYDLRVRHEGFDLELLTRDVGGGVSRFSAPPEQPAPTTSYASPQGPASSA